ncbi:hypothetical protein AX768_30865 (plasmid) [Burkholderia sp. PAMC 28687]|nr:hypothetical protein AX768_30865 [Burkholderia sp. PAMC 28687]
MDLLLPTAGRDNHVTIRNHAVVIGTSIQHARPVRRWCETEKPITELGIHVAYVRRARCNRKGSAKENRAEAGSRKPEAGNRSSPIAVVVAAVGHVGERMQAFEVWEAVTGHSMPDRLAA